MTNIIDWLTIARWPRLTVAAACLNLLYCFVAAAFAIVAFNPAFAYMEMGTVKGAFGLFILTVFLPYVPATTVINIVIFVVALVWGKGAVAVGWLGLSFLPLLTVVIFWFIDPAIFSV